MLGSFAAAFVLGIPKYGLFPIPDVAVASIVSGSNLLIPYPDPVGGALSVLMTLATARKQRDALAASPTVRGREA